MTKLGIIGGSGLDNPEILENPQDLEVDTPYGKPNSTLRKGTIAGQEVFLLARHGRAHTTPPTGVNYRANIWALKDQGCEFILATTAVGSLKLEIKRGDLVVLDQFIDFTRHRTMTFHEHFKPHEPVHTPMSDPFDQGLRGKLIAACAKLGLAHHPTGTVITIEGPRFSTRAESHMFRQWGADVINMSVATEAILAMEAGVAYAAVAMSTDYDCWKIDEAPVTWEDIIRIFADNAQNVTNLLVEVISGL